MLKKIKSFLFENKSDKQTILKNTFWLMLAEFLSKGSMFLITILIARLLGPTEFGMLSFVMSFVAMFVVITDFGLTTLMVREVSRDHSLLPSYLVNLSFLKIILGVVTFILVCIAGSFLSKEPIYFTLILIYTGYAILNNIGEFLRAFFRPSESMQYEALLKSINGVLMLLIVGGALFWKGDLESIMYGYLFAGAISLFVSFIYVGKRFVVRKLNLDKELMKKSLKSGVFLMGSIIFVTFFVSIDSFLLGYYGYFDELGIYSAMVKLTYIPANIIGIFIFSSIPNIIKKSNSNKIVKIVKLLFVFSLLNLLFFIIFGKIIINLLLGGEYIVGYILGIILFVKFIFVALDTFFYNLLNAYGYEKKLFIFTLIAGIINVVGNLIFIPLYQEYGAVVTTFISEIVLFLLIIFSYKNLYVKTR